MSEQIPLLQPAPIQAIGMQSSPSHAPDTQSSPVQPKETQSSPLHDPSVQAGPSHRPFVTTGYGKSSDVASEAGTAVVIVLPSEFVVVKAKLLDPVTAPGTSEVIDGAAALVAGSQLIVMPSVPVGSQPITVCVIEPVACELAMARAER